MNKIANYDWTHLEQDKNEYLQKGGLRKISGPPKSPCRHPEHNSPGMIVLEPGMYEHTCPGCGNKQIFTVSGVYL